MSKDDWLFAARIVGGIGVVGAAVAVPFVGIPLAAGLGGGSALFSVVPGWSDALRERKRRKSARAADDSVEDLDRPGLGPALAGFVATTEVLGLLLVRNAHFKPTEIAGAAEAVVGSGALVLQSLVLRFFPGVPDNKPLFKRRPKP